MTRSFEAHEELQKLRAKEFLDSLDEEQLKDLWILLPYVVDYLEEEYDC